MAALLLGFTRSYCPVSFYPRYQNPFWAWRHFRPCPLGGSSPAKGKNTGGKQSVWPIQPWHLRCLIPNKRKRHFSTFGDREILAMLRQQTSADAKEYAATKTPEMETQFLRYP
jgi:hypothetical protein